MVRLPRFAPVVLAALLSPAPLLPAQDLEPLGDQFQVNAFTAGDQELPDVTAGPDGRALIAWRSVGQIDPAGSIIGRRFSAAGDPDGGEIPFDDGDNELNQRAVGLWVQGDGDYLVGWDSRGNMGLDRARVEIARVDADGAVLGTTTIQDASNVFVGYGTPDAGVAADDSFFAAWNVVESAKNGGQFVRGRLFTADVDPAGAEVHVPSTPGDEFGPYRSHGRVAAARAGGFFAVWTHDPGLNPGPNSVRGRRIDAAGAPVGSEVILVEPGESPAIAALPGGSFVVAWQVDAGGGGGIDLFGRLIAADGSPLGPVFPINSHTPGAQREPDVAAAIGGFGIAWESETSAGDDDSGTSIQARWFGAAGAPSGSDLQVNHVTAGDQGSPRLAAAPNGTITVAWHSASSAGDDAAGTSVQARRLAPPGLVFADGFEAGDLAAWSSAQP